jgi:IS4 transposase
MSIKELTQQILEKMSNIGKWQAIFLASNFELQLQLRGRHNFLNMSRYGEMNESTYRENYSRDFDFKKFNINLINMSCLDELTVAFDPSYISKSGKHTPGAGYFWSGCAGHNKWGLEIGGFAAIDIKNNTAMHLIADQTLSFEEHGTLLNYYSALVCYHAETIAQISKYVVVDAYFSRNPFINQVCSAGLEVITRLRKDANLLYPYLGPHPKRRGAKTKYAEKFDPKNLNPAYFTCCIEEPDFRIYEATLYSKSLKRYIRVAIMYTYDEVGNFKKYKLYCSTDLTLSGSDIYIYYKTRFQIEFLYRDSKQFTGLEHCQSRSESKLHFHFNTALTTVSLAKALYHLNHPYEQRTSFSMADIKTQHFNELIMDLIFDKCGISPHDSIIIPIKKQILDFGKIRA